MIKVVIGPKRDPKMRKCPLEIHQPFITKPSKPNNRYSPRLSYVWLGLTSSPLLGSSDHRLLGSPCLPHLMETLASRVFGACSARHVNGKVISVIDGMRVGEGEVF